jgi:hypothetical protein
LAEVINFPSTEPYDRKDLAKVSSYFSEISGRDRLVPRLRGVFHGKEYTPCDIHLYLAELAKSADIAKNTAPPLLNEYEVLKPSEFKPLLIVTTNYDNLTEMALEDLKCPFDLVIHPTDHKEMAGSIMWWKHGAEKPIWCRPNKLEIDLNKTTVLYKMHGSASRVLSEFDSYVITEEDYIDFLSRMTSEEAIPGLFISHFYTRQFLFLGYGLKDWNFRVMLKNLKEKSKSSKTNSSDSDKASAQKNDKRRELKSWAIQTDPSELERFLWTARDVILFNEDLNKFVAGLRQHSTSLVRHISSKK